MTAFRQKAKAWTGALVLLLAVVFVGSAYHVHHSDRSATHDLAVIEATDHVVFGAHSEDGAPEKGDRHDKSTCQTCTLAAQLIAPPVLKLLTIDATPRDLYQRVDVERAGRAPPGLNRPPIQTFA